MTLEKTHTGIAVLRLSPTAHISLGKDKDIKWMHLSYQDTNGVRRGEMLSVKLTAVPTAAKAIIGKELLADLKTVLKDYINDKGEIPRSAVEEIANCL